ncbi:hypothetical protein P4O66_013251, partial [Electrophorus voltai]
CICNIHGSEGKMVSRSKSCANMAALSIQGLYFVVTLFLSSFFGSVFMLGPVLPVMILSPAWYRWLTDRIVATWLTLPVALLEVVFGVKVVITGDGFVPGERSVIIMNHRTRLDWMFLWCCLLRYSYLRLEKICLKAALKAVPGFGWAMQVAAFIFIHRKWEEDRRHMANMLEYFCDIREPVQLLLFPEGTDLTGAIDLVQVCVRAGADLRPAACVGQPELASDLLHVWGSRSGSVKADLRPAADNSRARSDKFADENGLPRYEYVLHPRTTGFTFIVDTLRKGDNLDAVHDITVAYPENIPQTERHLLSGSFPREIHFHVQRHAVASLPRQPELLEAWCRERWAEKEQHLRTFYAARPPAFAAPEARVPPCKSEWRVALVKTASLCYWTAFIALSTAGFWFWAPLRYYFLFMVVFFLGQQKAMGGLELIELACHRRRRGGAIGGASSKEE